MKERCNRKASGSMLWGGAKLGDRAGQKTVGLHQLGSCLIGIHGASPHHLGKGGWGLGLASHG